MLFRLFCLVLFCCGCLSASTDKETITQCTEIEQIHITLGGDNGIHDGSLYVTWITKEIAPTEILFKATERDDDFDKLTGSSKQYLYGLYESGHIHQVLIPKTLLSNNDQNKYVLRFLNVGNHCVNKVKTLNFSSLKTVCADCPVQFGVTGDLGQTEDSKKTINHLIESKSDAILHVGDLSYADSDQPRWDSYGSVIEDLASSVPYISGAGNHEMEPAPYTHERFVGYKNRYPSPSSDGHFFYSFESGGAHVIMLNSYESFHSDSKQYRWLERDLKSINRKTTPWVFVTFHAPWYNSNVAHHLEGESMRKSMEHLLVKYKVDLILAGHVHAYERIKPIIDYKTMTIAPLYINIGDGGNREGPADEYYEQPSWSTYRKAVFGHGIIDVKNSTHATWTWHRNSDGERVVGDRVVLGCDRKTSDICYDGCKLDENKKCIFDPEYTIKDDTDQGNGKRYPQNIVFKVGQTNHEQRNYTPHMQSIVGSFIILGVGICSVVSASKYLYEARRKLVGYTPL